MDNQGRGLPVLNKVGGAPALVALSGLGVPWDTTVLIKKIKIVHLLFSRHGSGSRVVVDKRSIKKAAYLVLGEVKLLGVVEPVLGIKDTVVVDQAVETIGVSVDPAGKGRRRKKNKS